MSSFFPVLSYPCHKLLIVALLAVNVIAYSYYGSLANSLDTLAWLLLLVFYELQNAITSPIILSAKRQQYVRNVLIVIIIGVFLRYLQVKEWLEVTNELLWFALIALLETEARWPDRVRQFKRSYWLASVLVFLGLIGVVVAWAWQSAWLDVYDASLWIIAFGLIDMDIFQLLQRKSV